MVPYNLIMMLNHLCRQRVAFFTSIWNMVDFLMVVFSVMSVVFYMIRSKGVLRSIKAIQSNPYKILHFQDALHCANRENAAIAVAVFMIFLFSSLRQSVEYQLSYVLFFVIIFNAFVVSGKPLSELWSLNIQAM